MSGKSKEAGVDPNAQTSKRAFTNLPASRLCKIGSEWVAEGEVALGGPIWAAGVRKDPERVEDAKCLAKLYFRIGQYDEATRVLLPLMQSEPRDYDAIFELGKSLMYARHYDLAEKILDCVRRVHPGAPGLLRDLEWIQSENGSFDPPPPSVELALTEVDQVAVMGRLFERAQKGHRFGVRDAKRLAELGYYAAQDYCKANAIELDELTDVGPFERFYGMKLSAEALAGRGFWPVKEGRIARKKAGYPNVSDISGEKLSFTEFSLGDGELAEYDWVKSFPNPDARMRGTDFLLLAVKIGKDGALEDAQLFRKMCESASCRGFGGFIIEMPGMEEEDSEGDAFVEPADIDSFDREPFDRELDFVARGRYLSPKQNLVGKKLPAAFDDDTYADTSVVRQAYWHMSVDSTDGVLESLDFSTYVSHGSGEADMFSRPQLMDDHIEDMTAGLLYILDKYTDDEWREVFGLNG